MVESVMLQMVKEDDEECDWKEIPRLPHPARLDRHLWRGNGRLARWAVGGTWGSTQRSLKLDRQPKVHHSE